MKKLSKNNIITIALIIAIYAIVFVLEKVIDSNSMLFIVLKKGAIYALVAVSMNLLNGFTGLFSLGQAGFMLIGAYAYAIFTIPVEYRDAVYQYFDGGIVQFSIPVIPALILAGLRLPHRPSGAAPQERLSRDSNTGLCRDYPRLLPVGYSWPRHQRLKPA